MRTRTLYLCIVLVFSTASHEAYGDALQEANATVTGVRRPSLAKVKHVFSYVLRGPRVAWRKLTGSTSSKEAMETPVATPLNVSVKEVTSQHMNIESTLQHIEPVSVKDLSLNDASHSVLTSLSKANNIPLKGVPLDMSTPSSSLITEDSTPIHSMQVDTLVATEEEVLTAENIGLSQDVLPKADLNHAEPGESVALSQEDHEKEEEDFSFGEDEGEEEEEGDLSFDLEGVVKVGDKIAEVVGIDDGVREDAKKAIKKASTLFNSYEIQEALGPMDDGEIDMSLSVDRQFEDFFGEEIAARRKKNPKKAPRALWIVFSPLILGTIVEEILAKLTLTKIARPVGKAVQHGLSLVFRLMLKVPNYRHYTLAQIGSLAEATGDEFYRLHKKIFEQLTPEEQTDIIYGAVKSCIDYMDHTLRQDPGHQFTTDEMIHVAVSRFWYRDYVLPSGKGMKDRVWRLMRRKKRIKPSQVGAILLEAPFKINGKFYEPIHTAEQRKKLSRTKMEKTIRGKVLFQSKLADQYGGFYREGTEEDIKRLGLQEIASLNAQ